jgi:multiple sugar transport system permease protein
MSNRRTALRSRQESLWGWILIAPLGLGLTIWVVFPMGLSLVTSLLKWDMISPPEFVGFRNYINLIVENELFRKCVTVTLYYTLVSVPVQLVVALVAALLLNARVRGVGVFRTVLPICPR